MHQPLLKRDVAGHALTYGDDAANYVTFEDNYMNGATVTWKNNNAQIIICWDSKLNC